jgi:hypothetical protein
MIKSSIFLTNRTSIIILRGQKGFYFGRLVLACFLKKGEKRDGFFSL